MNKTILETFIKKYNLQGTIEKVCLTVKNKVLSVVSTTDDRNVFCSVQLSDFTAITDNVVGVYDTAKLKQLLNVLDEEIDIVVNTSGDKVTSLTFTDKKNSEVQFVAADLTIIQSGPSPSIKTLPTFNCEVVMDDEFVGTFTKAKSALSDLDYFTLMMGKKDNKLKMVIGHANNINSNKVTMEVKTTPNLDKISGPLNFSAKYLKEILTANSDCSSSVLKVSDKGLAHASFTNGNFKSDYYMVAVSPQD
jgi:hypothetical protein